MNIHNFLKKNIFEPYTLEKLDVGLTNDIFKVITDTNIYTVRVPKNDTHGIFNYTLESEILRHVKEFDVTEVDFDKNTGFKLSLWVDNKHFDEVNDTNKIIKIAKLMKEFHSINYKSGITFNYVSKYETFKSKIIKPIFDITSYEHVFNEVIVDDNSLCLCHNDWVSGNMLFTEDKVYLIDYEYAADNHPYFDVMSFITENNIIDNNQRKMFYDNYFDEYNEETLLELKKWEKVHHLLWCTWAMMMYESRKEAIYYEIALDKYNQLISD